MLKRVAWTVVVLAALYGTVLFTLLSPAAPPPIESPLVPETSGWTPQPVRLRQDSSRPDEVTYQLRVSMTSPEELLKHQEIRLLVATYRTRPHLAGARLQLLGTPCSYETAPGAKLLDNQQLPLARGPGCQSIAPPATGELELSVRLGRPGKVAVWTFTPPAGVADLHSIVVSPAEPGVGTPRPILRGSYVDYPPPSSASRVELLSYMWQLSPKLGWLWLSVLASFGLAFAGSLIFPMRGPALQNARPPWRFVLSGAFGAFCFASALGLLYAVLTPPLMAPDEPSHLLGFAALTANRPMPSQTESWTRLTHLQRIRFHGTEHFRPEDVDRPWPEADYHLHDTYTDVQARSAGAAAYWKVIGRFLQSPSAGQTLIAVRLVNAFVFGLAVGVATAICIGCTAIPYPQLLCLPFLFVPTLPFFAMHMSNYSVLCAAYVTLASSLTVLFLDGSRAHWVGFPLGLGVAVMLAGGRSSLPLLAVIVFALLARILLGSRQSPSPIRSALIFWLGFALGVSLLFVLVEKLQLSAMLASLPASSVGAAQRWFGWSAQHAWALVALALAVPLCELAFWGLRSGVSCAVASRRSRTSAIGMVALAVAVVLSLLGSLLVPFPHVPMIQVPAHEVFIANPPSATAYTRQVVITAFTVFRLKEPDLFLYTSFFGGFGWFDTVPPATFLTGLAVLIGTSLVVLTLYLASTADLRRVLWLLTLFAGCGVSLVLYALSCYAVPVNLHGRYSDRLVPVLAFTGVERPGRSSVSETGVARRARRSPLPASAGRRASRALRGDPRVLPFLHPQALLLRRLPPSAGAALEVLPQVRHYASGSEPPHA